MPMGSAGAIAWLALAATVQLGWGFYPAILRFLQTKVPHTLTSLQLSFLINACALPTMLLQTATEVLYGVAWQRGHAAATSAMAAAGKSKRSHVPAALAAREAAAGASATQPLLSDSAQEELPGEQAAQEGDECPNCASAPRRASRLKRFTLLLGTTIALTALMVSQVFALLFVQAYISQMVFLLAPLLVSFLALALLHTPLPPFFWPTLLLMLAGSGMVVGGKAVAAKAAAAGGLGAGADGALLRLLERAGLHTVEVPGERLGLLMWGAAPLSKWDDVIGVGLSLLSAFSLAIFMLTIQVAAGAIREAEVLWANFSTQAVLSLLLTFALEHDKFAVLGQLLPWEWAVVVGTSVTVNWLGNLLQQITIRNLGAPQVAAFLPLRMVGSLIASYLILAEKLDNSWEGAGATVVMLTLSAYLYIQKRHSDRQAVAVLMDAVAQEP